MKPSWEGNVIWSGDVAGVATGSTRRCPMSGCTGVQVYVKWPDTRFGTWPCSKGLTVVGINEWRVQ